MLTSVLALLVSFPQSQSVEMIRIPLPKNNELPFFQDLSADGKAVIGYYYSGHRTVAFHWTKATKTKEIFPDSDYSTAVAIADDGLTIVGSIGSDESNAKAYKLKIGGKPTIFPLTAAAYESASGEGISGDGRIVLIREDLKGASLARDYYLLLANASTVKLKSPLNDGKASVNLMMLAKDGKSVLGSTTWQGRQIACRWDQRGRATTIGWISDEIRVIYPFAQSHDGSKFIGHAEGEGAAGMVLWANGKPSVPYMNDAGSARMSPSGNIIGSSQKANATLWTQSSGLVRLDKVLKNAGYSLPKNYHLNHVGLVTHDKTHVYALVAVSISGSDGIMHWVKFPLSAIKK
ncbi:MAG: hypothetical protein KF784_06610 [Fimbriimonadaceae bacterium]|nr:hypothetical protein [Fimbriimonadaceae bacterium]